MSYRLRIYQVPKAFVEESKNCSNMADFHNVYRKYCHQDVHIDELKTLVEEENSLYPLYYVGKELFDYGDRSDVAKTVYGQSPPLFPSETLSEIYEHYKPVVMSEETLKASIEWMRQIIVDIYKDLLREVSDDIWKRNLSQADRMRHHIESVLQTWEPEFGDYTAYNLNKGTDEIVASWLWEHQIWDLVRIYKTFDWDNYSLIFYGW